jgi:hypothetical protein
MFLVRGRSGNFRSLNCAGILLSNQHPQECMAFLTLTLKLCIPNHEQPDKALAHRLAYLIEGINNPI